MPIYEFACPKCRRIFSFLSKRIQPEHAPVCPKCGGKDLVKQLSSFAMIKGVAEPAATTDSADNEFPPGMDDARMERVMSDLERDMDHLDENNPRHVAHLMRKMKEAMPEGTTPKELEIAIRRLEQGEDPEKVEADMGDVLGDWMGQGTGGDGEEGGAGGGGSAGYVRDSGLYDY